MNNLDLRRATSASVVHHLDSPAEVSLQDLRGALANMAERIATLERERDELGRALRWFNAEVSEDAAAGASGLASTKGS